MRDTLLTIHILAASTWIGADVVGFIVNPRINPHAQSIAADHWHATVAGFKRYIYLPSYLIVMISGVLLVTAVDNSPYGLTDAFVVIGYIAVLLGAFIGMVFFERQSRKAAAAYDAGETQAAKTIERGLAIGSLIDVAVVVVATVAMVSKSGV